ncbi:hypothetical protein SV7mr_30320 [Stieleria bergensis]|uniref:Uncharacterized protein n=2 Tax=Stieleria bergensis TaxID=2528025 RepID=A0A517SWJ9_9BACT|nr:hypothetical protein SV7mr_30320 [Planctomycetes bacterium SV_7m_r]
MGFRHDIAKSLLAVIVLDFDDLQYRDIAEKNMADSTTRAGNFAWTNSSWSNPPGRFRL